MSEPIKIKVEFSERGWTPTPGHGGKYCASAGYDERGEVWETGNTPAEAIGSVIARWPKHFNIELSGLETEKP